MGKKKKKEKPDRESSNDSMISAHYSISYCISHELQSAHHSNKILKGVILTEINISIASCINLMKHWYINATSIGEDSSAILTTG